MGIDRLYQGLRSDDLMLEVAAGRIRTMRSLFKSGENPSIAAGAIQTIWDEGGLYSYPASATAMTISSSSGDDASAGDGARTVRVFGLDENWLWVVQDLTLNGQTAVSIPTPLLRVFRAFVLTTGISGGNRGDIYVGSGTVTLGVPANVFARIVAPPPLNNQTFMAVFTVPDGWDCHITQIVATTLPAQVQDASLNFTLLVRDNEGGEPFQAKYRTGLINSPIVRPLRPYLTIPQRADVEIRGQNVSGAQAIRCAACMDMILEKQSDDTPDLAQVPAGV